MKVKFHFEGVNQQIEKVISAAARIKITLVKLAAIVCLPQFVVIRWERWLNASLYSVFRRSWAHFKFSYLLNYEWLWDETDILFKLNSISFFCRANDFFVTFKIFS